MLPIQYSYCRNPRLKPSHSISHLSLGVKNQSGQALLLVLLSMAVMLTVVLSVSSRSISDVSVGTYEEDALRAFSAAEAGIEKALLTNQEYTNELVNPSDGSVSFTSEITNNPPGVTFVYPQALKSGESATFWFVGRNPVTGALTSTGAFTGTKLNNLCWGSFADATYASGEKPAVMVSVFYDWNTIGNSVGNVISSGDFTHLKVARLAYDPDDVRNDTNNFLDDDTTGGACSFGGEGFTYKKRNILFSPDSPCQPDRFCVPTNCRNTAGCILMTRVKLVYTDPTKPEKVGIDVQGGANLPSQGNKIESIGTAGNSTRKINVFQSYPEPLNIFDAAVFSSTSFSH